MIERLSMLLGRRNPRDVSVGRGASAVEISSEADHRKQALNSQTHEESLRG